MNLGPLVFAAARQADRDPGCAAGCVLVCLWAVSGGALMALFPDGPNWLYGIGGLALAFELLVAAAWLSDRLGRRY